VFFSPAQLERFWLPYLHKWATAVREMGLYTILHSDGDLANVLDLLAASPLQALQAIDPIAGRIWRRRSGRSATASACAATSIAACCTSARSRKSGT